MNLTFQCSKDATLTFCLGDGAAADVMTTMLECVKMMIRIIKHCKMFGNVKMWLLCGTVAEDGQSS